jgi:hypothetical protein
MATNNRRAKDQAMAAMLKGVVRHSARCPLCGGGTGGEENGSYYHHIAAHPATPKANMRGYLASRRNR